MDKTLRNKILAKIPYGLYIVGSRSGNEVSAIIANWVGQVSFEPPLMSVSIEHDSDMRVYIESSMYFSINMLPPGSVYFAKHFLKKSAYAKSTLNGKEIVFGKHGSPFLKDAVSSLECSVVNSVRAGDHILFVGEVIDGVSHSEEQILTLKETGWKYSR